MFNKIKFYIKNKILLPTIYYMNFGIENHIKYSDFLSYYQFINSGRKNIIANKEEINKFQELRDYLNFRTENDYNIRNVVDLTAISLIFNFLIIFVSMATPLFLKISPGFFGLLLALAVFATPLLTVIVLNFNKKFLLNNENFNEIILFKDSNDLQNEISNLDKLKLYFTIITSKKSSSLDWDILEKIKKIINLNQESTWKIINDTNCRPNPLAPFSFYSLAGIAINVLFVLTSAMIWLFLSKGIFDIPSVVTILFFLPLYFAIISTALPQSFLDKKQMFQYYKKSAFRRFDFLWRFKNSKINNHALRDKLQGDLKKELAFYFKDKITPLQQPKEESNTLDNKLSLIQSFQEDLLDGFNLKTEEYFFIKNFNLDNLRQATIKARHLKISTDCLEQQADMLISIIETILNQNRVLLIKKQQISLDFIKAAI